MTNTAAKIAKMTPEEAAEECAGNWKKWDSFVWWSKDQPEDAQNWMIYHHRNRGSDLLTQSNADVIEKRMKYYIDSGDAYIGGFSHWAVGHTDAVIFRVFREDGSITDAFREMYKIMEELDGYPVLDEDDWSRREDEDTDRNVRDQVSYILGKNGIDLESGLDDLSWKVRDLLPFEEVEARDGWGGYPSDESISKALKELGYDIKETQQAKANSQS
jgi:hypothetical protein